MARKKTDTSTQKCKPDQTSILNFFSKTEKQQSKLFSHVTRPRTLPASSSASIGVIESKKSLPLPNEDSRRDRVKIHATPEVSKKLLNSPSCELLTVIPETPESVLSNPSRSQNSDKRVSFASIPETPPGVAERLSVTKAESSGEKSPSRLKDARPPNCRPSKLSRSYSKLNKKSNSGFRKVTEINQGEENLLKPSKIILKKHSSKQRCPPNSKRSPERGSSPFAKRSQVNSCERSIPSSARKHLFIESFETSSDENRHLRQFKTGTFSSGRFGKFLPESSRAETHVVRGVRETDNYETENGINSKNKTRDGKTDPERGERRILTDSTNTDTARGDKNVTSDQTSSADVSVEWDDMNESLLASLDDDYLENEFVFNQNSDANQFKTEEDDLIPRLVHLSPFTKVKEQEPTRTLPPSLVRYAVRSTQRKENGDQILHMKNLSCGTFHTCSVSGVWNQIPYSEGDLLAIHGTCDESGEFNITQDGGFIIYEPDILLTGTAVSGSIRCMRRSVFDHFFKGFDEGNKAMVLGTIIHEVFDKATRKQRFDDASLQHFVADSLKIPSIRNKIYSMKLSEAELTKDAEEYFKPMNVWARKYLKPSPVPQGYVDIKWPGTKASSKHLLSIPRVCDIEENIWCPRWGLKGKVDVTAEVKIHRNGCNMTNTKLVLPLELKTGRQTNSIEHHSQVILYCLMMADSDSHKAPLGLLLYLKTGALMSVTPSHMDKRELVHLRNQLALHLSKKMEKSLTRNESLPPELPPPIEDDFTCSRCCHATTCSIMNKVNPATLSDAALERFAAQINHLSDSHTRYFVHWYTLCIMEYQELKDRNSTKDVWNMSAKERERRGGCHGGLIISRCKADESGVFHITFKRKERLSSPIKFEVGDWLIVSDEDTSVVAKSVGTVRALTSDSVTISTDSSLATYPANQHIYTLDKNESYDSMASSFNNLANLMSPSDGRSILRDIIIDLCPNSSVSSSPTEISLSYQAKKVLSAMNTDQRSAVKKVLQNDKFTLIMGMPGTGKTTTVAALVQILVLEGKSVLLTSYTHSAVDNILLKLKEVSVSFLRLGSTYRIHRQLHQYSEETMLRGCSVDQLAKVIATKPVIAATSLGVKSPLLSQKRFDYCIIDEASQISQPVCLAPLFKASKFVLVGDHKQLPPLVQSNQARIAGMDESLFQRLAAGCPESVCKLRLQYRMHPAIMDLNNALTYQGALRCGNQQVQSSLLDLPLRDASNDSLPAWLQVALSPETVVRFISTEQLLCKETENDMNRVEADLVKTTVQYLIQFGCKPEEIGIITPFRKQCRLLHTMMTEGVSKHVEVNTIDKYQGRDKNVIMVSFTLHQQPKKSILEDARRINVALTRAKKKLIMFGNGSLLRPMTFLSKLMGIVEEKGLKSIIAND